MDYLQCNTIVVPFSGEFCNLFSLGGGFNIRNRLRGGSNGLKGGFYIRSRLRGGLGSVLKDVIVWGRNVP